MKELHSAIQQFNNSKLRGDILFALEKIEKYIGTTAPIYSTQYLILREEFLKTISEDKTTIGKLCWLLRYDPGSVDRVLCILFCIGIYCTNPTSRQKIMGTLMESGGIELLLQMLPKLQKTSHFTWAIGVLNRFIDTSFISTNIQERSILWKANIFSNLRLFVNVANEVPDKECMLVTSVIDIFCSFLVNEGVDYCRSMVRSQLKDGTILDIGKLFSQKSSNERYVKSYLPYIISAFKIVMLCDQNTLYNRPNRGICKELRILTPIVVNNLSMLNSSENSIIFCTSLELLENLVLRGNDKDRQMLMRHKFVRKLAQFLLCEVRSKHPSHLRTSHLLGKLDRMLGKFRNVKVDDIYPVVPYLPKLIDIRKYPKGSEWECLSLLSAALTSDIVQMPTLGNEKLKEMLELNVIPLWIDITRAYHDSINTAHQSVVANLLFGMKFFVLKIGSLRVIDQVLCGFPFFLDYLARGDPQFRSTDPASQITYGIIKTFVSVTEILINIKDDDVGCIDLQLNALMECGLIPGVTKAVIICNDPKTLLTLVSIFGNLCHVMDNRTLIEGLVEFVPQLFKKQMQFASHANAADKNNIYSQIFVIIRKAVAYNIDDIDPFLLADEIAPKVLCVWSLFQNSGERMSFVVSESEPMDLTDHYYAGDAVADLLRATWHIANKYPKVIYECLSVQTDIFGDCKDISLIRVKMLRVIVDTLICYMDYSEEHSTDFLKELTAVVGDLSQEVVDCKEKEIMFRDLLAACYRFLKVHSHKALVENVQRFVDAMQKF